jgi:hypothetical protein
VNEASSPMKGEFLDWLSNYPLLENNCSAEFVGKQDALCTHTRQNTHEIIIIIIIIIINDN